MESSFRPFRRKHVFMSCLNCQRKINLFHENFFQQWSGNSMLYFLVSNELLSVNLSTCLFTASCDLLFRRLEVWHWSFFCSESLEEDLQKRIFISLWNRESPDRYVPFVMPPAVVTSQAEMWAIINWVFLLRRCSGQCEFVGCMSFCIRNICSRENVRLKHKLFINFIVANFLKFLWIFFSGRPRLVLSFA